MKIVNKIPGKTANINSARGETTKEFWRMVLAAVLALIAVYFLVGVVVDVVVSRISFETEAKIFKHFHFSCSEPKDPNAIKNFARAKSILERLKTDEQVPALDYELGLIEMEQPNAFAFPGGSIGVSTGLLEVLDKDIEIAFVIGHEIGHFHNRDHLKGLGRAAGFGIIRAIVFESSSGADPLRNAMDMAMQRNYSRDREKKADRFAVELVYRVYGKVEGTDRLFKILRECEDLPGWAYMFSTHPSPGNRIDALEKYAQEIAKADGVVSE